MIARRINGEGVVVLGWGRAILLQLAHPLVAAGVGGHSHFEGDPRAYLERMRRTIGAMLSLTFGTPAEVRAAADRINAIHARVHGRLDRAVGRYPAGTPYDATDPTLLAWVHATLVDSQIRTYALFVGPLTDAERDAYCAEAAQMGPWLGVDAEALPGTAAELAAYLAAVDERGDLAVGDTARRLAAALLRPSAGRWAGPAMAFGRLVTVGLLSPSMRRAYGLSWSGRHARALAAAAAVVRASRRVTPSPLREWPAARRARRRDRLRA